MATASERSITVQGKTYRYGITKYGGAVLYTPEGKKLVVTHFELTGASPATYERGVHKRTSDGMVTPSDIRKYIERSF